MPESSCADAATSVLCGRRTATAKMHCLKPRPAGILAPFHRAGAPPRRASRRRLGAPMWDAPGRWRKANVAAPRGARGAGRAAGRGESGPTCGFVWPCKPHFRRPGRSLQSRAASTRYHRSSTAARAHGRGAWSRPAQPTSSDMAPERRPPRGDPGRVARIPRRALCCAAPAVVRNDGVAAAVSRGRRPREAAGTAVSAQRPADEIRVTRLSAALQGKSARSRLLRLAGARLLL